MEVPASHQGMLRPDRKNSESEDEALFVKRTPITMEKAMKAAIIDQSSIVRLMRLHYYKPNGK